MIRNKRNYLGIILFIAVLASITFTLAQKLQHEAVAINIEVPVRVFKGNTFIDDLTMRDFEIYEDGKLQDIEAVYLIKKSDIKREEVNIKKEEARRKFSPKVNRNFILVFELIDYLPKLKESIDYFFTNVLTTKDSLIIATPEKTYNLNKQILAAAPREQIIEQLNAKLKKDITLGSREYKSLLRDYKLLFNSDYPLDLKLMMMKNKIREFKNLRCVDEKRVKDIAGFLKNMDGQKHVFFFYQKDILPFPPLPPDSLAYLDLQSLLASFSFFDVEKIKDLYADSSITIHFLYVSNPRTTVTSNINVEQRGRREMELMDISMDKFDAFDQMAKATGGVSDSSANVVSLLEKAATASENYYLLYYTPKNYKTDGKFKKIEIKVKGKNYYIRHRAGYFAD